jgi:DNA polymerase I
MAISLSKNASRLKELLADTPDLESSTLVSATYDGDKRVAVLKFYDEKEDRIRLYYDKSGHKPYCFTKPDFPQRKEVEKREDVLSIQPVEKKDLVSDRVVEMLKIITTDPLAIGGGSSERSLRNFVTCWEADIKYYENYLYDRGLVTGAYYTIRNGEIIPVDFAIPPTVEEALKETLSSSSPEFSKQILEWARLLSQPITRLKRCSVDIEVLSPEEDRIPDPERADYPIISAAIVGSDNVSEVFLLRRKDVEEGTNTLPNNTKAIFFDNEVELINHLFSRMMDYPVILTFNGDDFDIPYLYRRAIRFGRMQKEEIPVSLGNNVAYVKHGMHIDLYKTFINKSLQIYAFGNIYSEHTLNGVAEGLLGESKVEFEGSIGSLPLYELANYNLQDASITYKLSTFKDDVLMKLLVVIARVAKMPIEDLSRLGVSQWIRSMLYFEHRKRNALIPRREELDEKGGAASEAIIKGKKYKGGLVIEPKAGVHFNVSVLDFASLYPSIIKVHNLSYETVNCPHSECRANKLPETTHWVCKQVRGMESLIIGSLRDLRVDYFKPLARNPELTKEQKNLYNIVAQSLKVILNASYGVMGAEIFPLYCLPAADATASIGRYAITRTISKCEELGISVIYSDTDSLFLEAPRRDQIEEISKWTQKELGIELDVDKQYRYVALSSRKKNYLGVLTDGSVDIKGLTGKKSISGRTPILAKIGGKVVFSNVENVYREFKKGRQVELVTVSNDLRTLWMRVTDASSHIVTDPYILKTNKGRELKLSGDHSIYVIDTLGNLRCKETKDVLPGDVVIGARLIPSSGESLEMDAETYIPGNVQKSRPFLYSNILNPTTEIPVQSNLPISHDLMFLLGIFTGEGNVPSQRTSCKRENGELCLDDFEVCKAIKKSWQKIFGFCIEEHTTNKSATNFYIPPLHASFFKNLCGQSSSDKHVPTFLFCLSKEFIATYLRGLFSMDGYANEKKINISSKNPVLLGQVAYLLAYFDIDCSLREARRSKCATARFRLSITDATSRKNFMQQIGFVQTRFNINQAPGRLREELLPISLKGLIALKESILRRHGIVRFAGIDFHHQKYYNMMLVDRYSRIIDSLRAYSSSEEEHQLRKISQMINSHDVSFDEVVSVEKIRGPRLMYDFGVPGYERFVAGNLPTLVHNSQTPDFIKTAFYETLEILSRVQTQADFEKAREEIRNKLRSYDESLRQGRISKDDLAFHVMLGKDLQNYGTNGRGRLERYGKQTQVSTYQERSTHGLTMDIPGAPQHVKAAIYLQMKKNKMLRAGDIVSFVKTKTPPGAKPVELVDITEVDVGKYEDYMRSTFDQILGALGFEFQDILAVHDLGDVFHQSSLDQFAR